MKYRKQFFAAAFLLSGCAQQPTTTTQPVATIEPRLTPAQQQLVEQFNSMPCATANGLPTDTSFNEIAVILADRVQQLSQVNPENIPNYSAQVFNRYLDELDNHRIYFMASDIDAFKLYEQMLWPTLKSGNAKPGYCIFDQYSLRIKESLTYAVDYLKNGISEQDMNGSEVFTMRNAESPNFTNEDERKTFWRKRVTYDVLLKVSSGTPFAEAKEQLIKRYQGHLNRQNQVVPNDVFTIYANAFLYVLDPHSQFFAPRISASFNKSLNLEGIGLVLQQSDEGATVVSTLSKGPSDGKLNPGDVILSVAKNGTDFEPISGWRLDDIVEVIRGPKGSFVGLEIKPIKQNMGIVRMSIMRDYVKLNDRSVESEIITVNRNGNRFSIGVVHIPAYYADFRAIQAGDKNARSTSNDLARHLYKLKQEKISGLVIDLTDNGGGSLQEAHNVASMFIPKEPTFLITKKGETESITNHSSNSMYLGPVIVLVTDRSAGASEIVAAAIQDYEVGLVVGERTFGMGSVASLQQLATNPDSTVKLAIAEFVRATGKPFLGHGVTPDIELPSTSFPIREKTSTNRPSSNYFSRKIVKAGDLSSVRPELIKRSTSRQKAEPAFTFIQSTNLAVTDSERLKAVTLNLGKLKTEMASTQQASNQRYEMYMKATSEKNNVSYEDSDVIEKRAWIQESGEIIVDWLDINK